MNSFSSPRLNIPINILNPLIHPNNILLTFPHQLINLFQPQQFPNSLINRMNRLSSISLLQMRNKLITSRTDSLIQIFMMWLVIKSVGLADSMWNTIVDYISTEGSVVSTATVIQNQYLNLASNITYSMICMQRAHTELDLPFQQIGDTSIPLFSMLLPESGGNKIDPTSAPIKQGSASSDHVTYDFGAKNYGGSGGLGSVLVKCGSLTITKTRTGSLGIQV